MWVKFVDYKSQMAEDLNKKIVFQKVGCIVLGIVGMTIMFL